MMQLNLKAIAFFGMTTIISGLALSIFALPAQSRFSVAQSNLENSPQELRASTSRTAQDFFNQASENYNKGDYTGAIESYTQVLRLDPKYVEAYCNRGLIKTLIGDTNGAITDFHQVLKLAPHHADAYNRLGNAHANIGQLNAALEDFNQAVRLDPKFADAYYNRGLTRFNLKDSQGAITDYTQALKLNPNLAEAYGNRGLTRNSLGDKSGALEDLQKAAQLFRRQGDLEGYEYTQELIKEVEQ